MSTIISNMGKGKTLRGFIVQRLVLMIFFIVIVLIITPMPKNTLRQQN